MVKSFVSKCNNSTKEKRPGVSYHSMAEQQHVTLLIGGKIFNARKDVLIEYSDYFRAMFSGNYVEKEQQQISIDVVDADSMVLILKYMEVGLIDLTEYSISTIGDLAIAANFLQITELVKQIEYCLEEQLLLSNWIEIMEIAQNASLGKLEQYSVAYGLFLFKSMKTDYIQTIHKLFWYLSHQYLSTESELQVFRFGLQWIDNAQMGAEALLILLCCLDISSLESEELKEIKELVQGYESYVNSFAEKVIDCLYKLSTDFALSLETITEKKSLLCELYTEKVYMEVVHLVKESIQRKLKFTPIIPLCSASSRKPEELPQYLSTFTAENGFQHWFEVVDKNLWGWNIAAWGATKIVYVCGELGRGTGHFMRDVRVYDTLKKQWSQHGIQLPCRRHAGVAIVEDSLFIIGGVGGYRIVLETAIIYDLKEKSFRKIAKFPDAIQSPAVCAHENSVYAGGHNNIYKYEDTGESDRWSTVLRTNMRPFCMVSFKGYIYVTQCFYISVYRFKPNVDTELSMFANFCWSPVAACSIGTSLMIFTSTNTTPNTLNVEEYQVTNPDIPAFHQPKIIWTENDCNFTVNGITGTCSVVMTMPKVDSAISPYHKRCLAAYEQSF